GGWADGSRRQTLGYADRQDRSGLRKHAVTTPKPRQYRLIWLLHRELLLRREMLVLVLLFLLPFLVFYVLWVVLLLCLTSPSRSSTARNIVTQKDLTFFTLCKTVMGMANVLSTDKQIAVIGALAEGSSIRSIERMTGVHRDTVMRLGVRVGQGCAGLLDAKMRDLPCRYLQFDEVWGFIGKKERHLRIDDDPKYGDVWTV